MMHNGDVFEHPNSDQIMASVDEALSVAITWTPRDALEAKEPVEIDAREHAERLRVAVRVRSFVRLAEFLTAGVSQADELEMRSLIVLRAAAPALAWDCYRVTVTEIRRKEKKLQREQKRRGRKEKGETVSLTGLLRGGIGEEEQELAQMQDCTAVELRRKILEELCAMIAKEARKLSDFPKIAVCILRRVKPDYMRDFGLSGAEHGRKFGQQRATISAREIRVVEEPLLAAGVKGVHLLGGTKSDAHRAACAEAQKGNRNRANGEARKRGESIEETPDEDEVEARRFLVKPGTEESAALLRRLRVEAEQRRLVALFGEGVAGCDPDLTLPMRATDSAARRRVG